MATEIPSRADIPVELTAEEYEQAALLHARRVGRLRTLPLVIGVSLVLLAAGFYSLRYYQGVLSLVPSAVFLLLGVLLPVLYVWREPAAVKKQARADYAVFSVLMQPMTVSLCEDDALIRSARVEMADSYALMPLLLETADMLLLIKDSGRFLAIPKRCIPVDQREAVCEFLQRVFVRKYRRVSRWWL